MSDLSPLKNEISRNGVFGVVLAENKILLVEQLKGPFKGKLALPGGKIECWETIEYALRREFLEEVGGVFESFHFLDNLSITVEVPEYVFHQIGLIYQVEGFKLLPNLENKPELPFGWYDMSTLEPEMLSPFVEHVLKLLSQK